MYFSSVSLRYVPVALIPLVHSGSKGIGRRGEEGRGTGAQGETRKRCRGRVGAGGVTGWASMGVGFQRADEEELERLMSGEEGTSCPGLPQRWRAL